MGRAKGADLNRAAVTYFRAAILSHLPLALVTGMMLSGGEKRELSACDGRVSDRHQRLK